MSAIRDIPALIEMIEARTHTGFAWRGGRDCVSFAAAAVTAQSGVDPRGNLRWNNKREAMAIIAAEGGLEAAFDRRFRRIPLALAMRGDIGAVTDAEFGIRLVVVEGAMILGVGGIGLERQPRQMMICAWDALSNAIDVSEVA